MSCCCDINPDKCRKDCPHFTKDNSCGNCCTDHTCICLLSFDDMCRSNEHKCINNKNCLCDKCNDLDVEIIDDTSPICEGTWCFKKPVMKCPICMDLGLKAQRFCSPKCFKEMWKSHKLEHKKPLHNKFTLENNVALEA
jgi:hypothetical protein